MTACQQAPRDRGIRGVSSLSSNCNKIVLKIGTCPVVCVRCGPCSGSPVTVTVTTPVVRHCEKKSEKQRLGTSDSCKNSPTVTDIMDMTYDEQKAASNLALQPQGPSLLRVLLHGGCCCCCRRCCRRRCRHIVTDCDCCCCCCGGGGGGGARRQRSTASWVLLAMIAATCHVVNPASADVRHNLAIGRGGTHPAPQASA